MIQQQAQKEKKGPTEKPQDKSAQSCSNKKSNNNTKPKSSKNDIPQRALLPDGSTVNFGHSTNPSQPTKKKFNANNKKGVTLRQEKNRAVLKEKADEIHDSTENLKKLLIAGVTSNSTQSAPSENSSSSGSRISTASSDNRFPKASLPDGSTPVFSQKKEKYSKSSLPNGSRPDFNNGKKNKNYNNDIPPVQSLPDGQKPNFGNSTNSSNASSLRGNKKNNFENSQLSSSPSDQQSQFYAGSSFQTAPSAVSLPKPSFL